MTREEISRLAAGGESETLEFKETTGQRREAAEAVCAMLNHRGGQVLFGVEPEGAVRGQEVGKDTLDHIARELQQIAPATYPGIVEVDLGNGRSVIVVTTGAGPTRPYTYRGRAYRRVGSTNLRLSSDEYNRMLMERLHPDRRWETEPATGWEVADLDADQIANTVTEAVRRGRLEEPDNRAPEAVLRGLRLLTEDGLRRAAVVLFGRDSDRVAAEYPQCLLRVARFRGTSRADEFLDNRQFRGNAFYLLRHALRFFVESLPIAGRIVGFTRVDEPLYPPEALREAVANAICHRDYATVSGSIGIGIYDDRLEVTSIGPLRFGFTPEALFEPHQSRPWNPLIAEVFYRRGIIETWGSGTIKMARLTEEAGLPRPEIEEAGGAVTVRFRPGRYVPPQRVETALTERQRSILAVLEEHPSGAPLRDIFSRLLNGATERQVRDDLQALRTLDLAETSGHGRGARWRRKQGPRS